MFYVKGRLSGSRDNGRAPEPRKANRQSWWIHPSPFITHHKQYSHPQTLESQLTASILKLTVSSSEWHKFMLFFLKWKTMVERPSANRPGNHFQTCGNSWGDLWSTVSIAHHWRGPGKWIQISNDYAFDVSKLCIVCSMTSSKTYHGSMWRSKHRIVEFTVKDSCCGSLPSSNRNWHIARPAVCYRLCGSATSSPPCAAMTVWRRITGSRFRPSRGEVRCTGKQRLTEPSSLPFLA